LRHLDHCHHCPPPLSNPTAAPTAAPPTPSLPRRSSDLKTAHAAKPEGSINATKRLFELVSTLPQLSDAEKKAMAVAAEVLKDCQDRKSTRLNSSHVSIAYAVFCRKNKREARR